MNRHTLFAAIVATFVAMLVVQSVVAAPRLPRSRTRDAIEGYCNENGGDFITTSDGHYACFLKNGEVVWCDPTGWCTVFTLLARPPARLRDTVSDALILAVEHNILAAEQSNAAKLTQLSTEISNQFTNLTNTLGPVCSPSDLVPLPMPAVAGPEAYCRLDVAGYLHVVVYNQGGISASASTTRVTFADSNSTSFDLPTSALSGFGGSVELLTPQPVPASCFGPDRQRAHPCDFTIGVDFANQVAESDETNNTVAGRCSPDIIF